MKRIVLTNRDEQIIEFLKNYKCAKSSTISKLFFNSSTRPCNRRLKYLNEHGFIKSSQEYVSTENIHYINRKPTQLKHSCLCSEFISKMKIENNVIKDRVEFKIGNIRSDLLVITQNENIEIFLVEVCITKPFDLNKYINLKRSLKWKEVFPVFPNIIVISDKKVNKSIDLNIIEYDLNLNKKE